MMPVKVIIKPGYFEVYKLRRGFEALPAIQEDFLFKVVDVIYLQNVNFEDGTVTGEISNHTNYTQITDSEYLFDVDIRYNIQEQSYFLRKSQQQIYKKSFKLDLVKIIIDENSARINGHILENEEMTYHNTISSYEMETSSKFDDSKIVGDCDIVSVTKYLDGCESCTFKESALYTSYKYNNDNNLIQSFNERSTFCKILAYDVGEMAFYHYNSILYKSSVHFIIFNTRKKVMYIEEARDEFEREQAEQLPMSYPEFKRRMDEYENITGRRYGEYGTYYQKWKSFCEKNNVIKE